jgi:predicted nucleic acid-binding protein
MRQALTSKGIIAGDFDILIAVTARHYDLTVVTHNTKHFGQMPGIQCIDWVD